MPASPQRVPVVLQSAAQRSPCGSAARGGRGSAEPPSDSLPCHFLCAPRSSAWLRAGARLWRGRCGRPWEAAARFHVCRGLPAREAGPRAQLLGGPMCSQPGFFRTQSRAPALGEACGPQQALLCGWSPLRARPCGKVKINHGREGFAQLAARSGGSLVPALESHQQLPKRLCRGHVCKPPASSNLPR